MRFRDRKRSEANLDVRLAQRVAHGAGNGVVLLIVEFRAETPKEPPLRLVLLPIGGLRGFADLLFRPVGMRFPKTGLDLLGEHLVELSFQLFGAVTADHASSQVVENLAVATRRVGRPAVPERPGDLGDHLGLVLAVPDDEGAKPMSDSRQFTLLRRALLALFVSHIDALNVRTLHGLLGEIAEASLARLLDFLEVPANILGEEVFTLLRQLLGALGVFLPSRRLRSDLRLGLGHGRQFGHRRLRRDLGLRCRLLGRLLLRRLLRRHG